MIKSSPSFSVDPRPLQTTDMLPLMRLNFYKPSNDISRRRFDPYLQILQVSLGATLLKTGNQLESQVRFKSTLKSGMFSRTSKMARLFCSKNYCFILLFAWIRIFRIYWCFIAIATSRAFISSQRGLNLGQVYISVKILTASMLPSFTARSSGVLPHGSSWFFSEQKMPGTSCFSSLETKLRLHMKMA